MTKKIYLLDYMLEPKSCPRPRVTKSGHAFMPKDYIEWKRRFIEETAVALGELYPDFKTIDYPIKLAIQFIFPRPQRLQHREIPSIRLHHASKPDIDNCIKSVMDGLSDAQVYRDDNVVSSITATKFYCAKMEDGSYEYAHISVQIFEA